MIIIKKNILVFTIALLFVQFFCNADELENELRKVRDKIDESYFSFDVNKWKSLLKTSIALKKEFPNDWRPYYYSGLICHQIGKILYLPDADNAYNYFDKSVDYLLEAKKRNYNAETAALLSSAYGKKSSLSTLKAIYYGIKARDYIYDANEIEKLNPKVLLIAAIHLMHTPESFGGDKKWAEELLNRALKLLYKQNREDDLSVNWANEAEIYAYFAQLEILKENKSKAKLFIDKALKLEPNYGFVLFDLIPQMEK
ncbi:MAG: hypothetical protein V1779_10300 [bacterium]